MVNRPDVALIGTAIGLSLVAVRSFFKSLANIESHLEKIRSNTSYTTAITDIEKHLQEIRDDIHELRAKQG